MISLNHSTATSVTPSKKTASCLATQRGACVVQSMKTYIPLSVASRVTSSCVTLTRFRAVSVTMLHIEHALFTLKLSSSFSQPCQQKPSPAYCRVAFETKFITTTSCVIYSLYNCPTETYFLVEVRSEIVFTFQLDQRT